MTHCHTLISSLRKMGYRITPQRELIIETLAHCKGHLTAEQILHQIHPLAKAVNLATVYRTLDLLVDKEMATRTNSLDGTTLYASMQHGPHIHLICRKCGVVTNADHALICPLADELKQYHQFVADLQHITIFGLCSQCQENHIN